MPSSIVRPSRAARGETQSPPASLTRLVREGPFTVLLTDLDLKLIEVAKVWCDETGMTRDAMLGRSIEALFPGADLAALMGQSLAGKRTVSEPIRVGIGDQQKIFRLESGPWRHDDGRLGGILTFGRDVTAVLQSRGEIERSERRLKMALEIDRSVVWERDLKTGKVYMTGSLAELVAGFREAEDPMSLVHPEDRERFEDAWRKHVRHGAPYEIEFRHVCPDGQAVWLRNVQTLVRDADGEPDLILGVTKDITQRREAEAEIERLAYRDTLTGLCNRTLFQRQFHEAVSNADRLQTGLGLIIIDIDHFKDVNDSYGHDAGDALLRAMAGLLARAFRKSDVIARLGGDEFAIVLPDLDHPSEMMRPIETLLKLLRSPIDYNGRSFTVGASLGAALYTHGEEAAQLLKNADIALYEAKYAGRNRVVMFEPAMRAGVETRIERLREVRAGLGRGEFVLYYQPVVDVRSQTVAGFEALMRWNHPEKGVLQPEYFMAAFEDQDLSLKLGDLAFDQALMQMRAWIEQGLDFGRVAVNVSSAQFRNEKLATTVRAKLRRWGVPADRLTIEVTENVYMGWSSNVVSETIRALHDDGVLIALDDFGTGYASLANLRQFPIDRLKIDKAFVQNPEDDAIVRAVIGLGASMGMKVVAEGVERLDQLDSLAAYGCDQVQGFHFAKPMPGGEVPGFIRGFANLGGRKRIA